MSPPPPAALADTTSGDPVHWFPARILRERGPASNDEHGLQSTTSSSNFALVILNQPLADLPALKRLWNNSCWRVAADGGANRLLDVVKAQEAENGRILESNHLDTIIGDLDSLSDEARAYFASPKSTDATISSSTKPTTIINDPDQYSTDFGKAVSYIRKCQPTIAPSDPTSKPLDIVAMGGLGGRVDQGLSQLHHLYLFQKDSDYKQGRMFLVSEDSMTFLLKAGKKHRIHVREQPTSDVVQEEELFDKYVGIIPIKEPSVITTKGLEWDVMDWETEFGGMMSTSNHVLPETKVVDIETTKDVLFTIALKRD